MNSEVLPDDTVTTPHASARSGSSEVAAQPLPLLTISATFTIESIEAPLEFMLGEAGLPMELAFAPYHQVFQEMVAPQSLSAGNATGVSVFLLRLEDFVRDAEVGAGAGSGAAELLARTLRELTDAALQFAKRCRVPVVFAVMRPTPMALAGLESAIDAASTELLAALRQSDQAVVLDSADVDPLCDVERFDAVADRLAHIPYTDNYMAALSIALARAVHRVRVPAQKVLVLDCDNTVWRGVVGEDGPQGIGLDAEFLEVQQFAVDTQAMGTLVCLASKNTEADVVEVLEARPDMVLKAEHIVAHRINWDPKVANLGSLAAQLNLGLDSFVFVDDNPVECGQMREALPDVVTLQLPPPGEVSAFLKNLWAFDKISVTQEDVRRTSMYRENAARDSVESQAVDLGQFLAELELSIDIGPPAEHEWPRVSQLTQRTNQFNFTTVRRSEAEVRALQAAGSRVLAVQVRDRFGDYGLVGLVIARGDDTALQVDTFLLSCRVLGRGVEHAIVARLGELAVAEALAEVRMHFVPTPKNVPARAFADAVAGKFRQGGDGPDAAAAFDYVIPSAVAAALTYRAGDDAEEIIEARRADAKKGSKPAGAKGAAATVAGRSVRYSRLAIELTSGPAVVMAMRAMRAQDGELRDLPDAAVAPRTATERALLLLWEEILGIGGLGVDDDFFALGGTSLQAARLFAAISHNRGVTLPLTTIIEAPTIGALARRVDGGEIALAGGLVLLRRAGERKLFLVHDGDGETLLYRNLAHRAPRDLSVFGIQPARLKNVPLAHDSIEAMAAFYITSVRTEQPHGPYLLGGMCAGGLIAYEMAVQLERAGEAVERVLLLDSATPNAARKPATMLAHRKSRLGDALSKARQGRSGLGAALASLDVVGRKVIGASSYEIGRIAGGWSAKARFALLQRVLANETEWPSFMPPLDFRTIYNAVEARYVPTSASNVPAVLVRARSGQGDDVPYVDVFADPTFGWGAVILRLEVADTDGGHASMLQEPHAAVLLAQLHRHLDGAAVTIAGAPLASQAAPDTTTTDAIAAGLGQRRE